MSRISESTVRRLSHYYRVLEEVGAEGKHMISSPRRARGCDVGAGAQGPVVLWIVRAARARLGPLVVQDVAELPAIAARGAFEIGVITTPAAAAQDVAAALTAAGIRGILNFAPRKLFVPKHVTVRNVEMTLEFESLSFALTQQRAPRPRRARG